MSPPRDPDLPSTSEPLARRNGAEIPDAATLSIGPRHIVDVEEYVAWRRIMSSGFTDWYGEVPSGREAKARWREANTRSSLFPEFTHEVRTQEGKAIAYLNTVPGYWSGDPQALHDLHYYVDGMRVGARAMAAAKPLHRVTVEMLDRPRMFSRLTRRYRERKLHGANCVVLVSMAIDPEYRGLQIPTRLLDAAKATARQLGMHHVVAAFRPNGYGPFKAAGQHAHTPALFAEYCSATNEEGLPIDPWLRVLTRNGVRFLRPEPRSFQVAAPLAQFESFRLEHRPADWYSPGPDVWECGETPTWYVDRYRNMVTSVEPNIWGYLDVSE